MIKTIMAGQYINIQNAYTSNPYISPGTVGAGQLRWNTNMNEIEVNDGLYWQSLTPTSPTIELNSEARALLEYVKQQQQRDERRQQRIENNPALKKAYEAIVRAEENYDMLDKIVGECQECES